MAGEVRLGEDGPLEDKPGQLVQGDAPLVVDAGPEFVSRGGQKLANALDALGVDPARRLCLDVGASTGGFTDCLLQRGAERVIALDVAYGELHWRIRNHPRVVVMERLNARTLEPDALPYRPELIVVDVSFISLEKVLPAVLACAASRFDCLALVKPQFELGRERVGKGGVVRSPDDRREALLAVGELARDRLGLSVLGFASSGLPGPAGNRESFAWIGEPGREGAAGGLEAAARAATREGFAWRGGRGRGGAAGALGAAARGAAPCPPARRAPSASPPAAIPRRPPTRSTAWPSWPARPVWRCACRPTRSRSTASAARTGSSGWRMTTSPRTSPWRSAATGRSSRR